MGRVCVLYSAGIESSVLLHELSESRRVVPVYVRNGFRWEETEIEYGRRMTESVEGVNDLEVFDTPVDDIYPRHWGLGDGDVPDEESSDESVYLPGRSLLLLSKPAVFCSMNGVEEIYHGTLAGNPFPDSTREFFDLAENLYGTALDATIDIKTPYADIGKKDVIHRGLESDVPFDLTFSCIDPIEGKHCGACNKCGERHREFEKAGVEDSTEYVNEF